MYKGAVYMFCIDYTLLFNLPDNGFRTRNLLECWFPFYYFLYDK